MNMLKRTLHLLLATCLMASLLIGCSGTKTSLKPEPQRVSVAIEFQSEDIKAALKTAAKAKATNLKLSNLSFFGGGKLHFKIYSGISVADVSRFWNDMKYMVHKHPENKDVVIFLNSPGGSAFDGLALSDLIRWYQADGYTFTVEANGIVASAAVPVFSVCDVRMASRTTIFMVHEAALWKWPGRETASDIRSQGELMDLLKTKYLSIMVDHSNLTYGEWEVMEVRTSWFGTKKGKEYGIVDEIR